MFERRQRAISNLGFNHVQRSLQRGEQIPALPCLTEQILACRHELARSRREAEAEDVYAGSVVTEAYDAEDD